MSSKCFKIVSNSSKGRHLIAARDICKGETIIDEPPVVFCPAYFSEYSSGSNYCISCCRSCPQSPLTCPQCQLAPFCSLRCTTCEIHSGNECKILQRSGTIFKEIQSRDFSKKLVNFIVLVRSLVLYHQSCHRKEEGDQKETGWSQIKSLESKWMEFEKIGGFSHMEKVFGMLSWGLFDLKEEEQDVTELDIVTASKLCLGVMRNNAFSHYSSQYSFEGLYFLSSFMSHSCSMNTDRLFDPITMHMVTKAAVDIPEGTEITTCYISLLNNNFERRKELWDNWLFLCECPRCSDSTEYKTDMGAFRCSNCGESSVFREFNPHQSHPQDFTKCTNCLKVNCRETRELIQEFEDSKPQQSSSFEDMEAWLEKYKDMGSFNLSGLIQIQCYLAQLYGRLNGCDLASITDEQLERKIRYSENVLNLFDKLFEPNGIYFLRGTLLFELWSSLREKSSRLNQDADAEIRKVAEKAHGILKYSIPNTSEHSMASILEREYDFNPS